MMEDSEGKRRGGGALVVVARENGKQKGIEDARGENVCLILAKTVDGIEDTHHIDRVRKHPLTSGVVASALEHYVR
jgi:hypothetical protein